MGARSSHARYGAALDTVLALESDPITVLTLLTALRHRSAMHEAFKNRDETSVQPIFKWVQKHIKDPRYVSICVDSALILLDLYAEHAGGSADLAGMIRGLNRVVKAEVLSSETAWQTSGMLQMLMTGMP